VLPRPSQDDLAIKKRKIVFVCAADDLVRKNIGHIAVQTAFIGAANVTL
jgi:hypothetical protein